MTCKDCLYHEKCYSRIAYCMDIDESTGKEITDIEKRCNDFKNKADYVEVVRCKDCRYFTEGMAVGMCKRDEDKPIIPCSYNHFCSYGERRDT